MPQALPHLRLAPASGGAPARARRGIAVSLVVLAAALGAIAFAQTAAGRNVTYQLGIAAPSEPFTELYLVHPSDPAGSAVAAGARVAQVSFGIRNRENAPRAYHWSIQVTPGATLRGTTALAAGAATTVVRSAGVTCAASAGVSSRYAVRVALARPAEAIGYVGSCHG